MAKAQTFEQMIDAHIAGQKSAGVAGAAPPATKAFGLPWWFPTDYILSQAIAIALTAIDSLNSETAKKWFRVGLLRLFKGIRAKYKDDPEFTCE